MTDEENKAIKDCDNIFICLDDAMSEDSANDYRKSYKILKNLIEKQSKEIEELKMQLEVEKIDNKYNREEAFEEMIPRYKIKAKIEEVEQWELYNMKIPRLSTLDERLGAKIGIKYVLQSLLEKE